MDRDETLEKKFESDIEQWLLTEGGYVKGDQKTYDKEQAIHLG
jgi:type I restriction enzyme R subunit